MSWNHNFIFSSPTDLAGRIVQLAQSSQAPSEPFIITTNGFISSSFICHIKTLYTGCTRPDPHFLFIFGQPATHGYEEEEKNSNIKMLVLLITVRTHLCHFRLHAGRPSVVTIVEPYISSFIIIISTITACVVGCRNPRNFKGTFNSTFHLGLVCRSVWMPIGCLLRSLLFGSYSSSGLHMCSPCLVTTKKRGSSIHIHRRRTSVNAISNHWPSYHETPAQR